MRYYEEELDVATFPPSSDWLKRFEGFLDRMIGKGRDEADTAKIILGVLISGGIERMDAVPSLDDEEAIDLVLQDFYDRHGRDPEEGPELARLEAYAKALRQQLMMEIEAIERRHEGLSIDLSDIAQEAKSAGYRAVHVHGVRQGDALDEEIVVLYPEDLVMSGPDLK
jgi:uncharacterized protein (UPF0335 family)